VTAAVAKATADPRLIENLRQLMGAGRVITEPSQRSYYSTDLSAYPAVTAAAVIQPGSVEELAQAVKLVAAAGYALIPRGGGMSYTKGYVPERSESVLFDMRGMNGIVEINTDDMYVTVEAGCTWKQLYEALQPRGVRTPYYGPLSGMYATVGGTLSQNSLLRCTVSRCPNCEKRASRVSQALTLIKKLMRLLDHEKRCARCGHMRVLTDFYAHPYTSDGFETICKRCKRLTRNGRLREEPEHESYHRHDHDRDEYCLSAI
jgi:hypothetical protein